MTDLAVTPRTRRPRPPVVRLTEAAAAQVCAIIEKRETPCAGLRVGLKKAGCAGQEYVLSYAEAINPLDEVIEDQGVQILIDASAVLYLIGTVIDYEVTPLASRFVFENPNQTDACGCGESVTLTPAVSRD